MATINANEHIAAALNATMRRHKAAERNLMQGPVAVGPGGVIVDASPYLRNLHNAEQHASVYGLVDKYPERYFKDPKPGYHYLWIDTKDQVALGRVRSGQYEEIVAFDLLEDTDLPFVTGPTVKRLKPTHKGTDEGVYLYDLQLVRCSPNTWNRLFAIREAMGMAKITSGADKLQALADRLGADITTDFEMTPEGQQSRTV